MPRPYLPLRLLITSGICQYERWRKKGRFFTHFKSSRLASRLLYKWQAAAAVQRMLKWVLKFMRMLYSAAYFALPASTLKFAGSPFFFPTLFCALLWFFRAFFFSFRVYECWMIVGSSIASFELYFEIPFVLFRWFGVYIAGKVYK